MKILITGQCGFIGAHVWRLAEATGNDLVGIDRKTGLDLVQCTPRWIDDADVIVHCAAHADVRYNWPDGLGDIERDNVTATLRLLDAAASVKSVKLFVFVSTGAVYAGNSKLVTEQTVPRARSPYAASKLTGEAYVQAYAHKLGWHWYVVRPAACFGPGYHHGHVADFVEQMKTNGKIHALDKGTRHPAMHVHDLARAVVRLATCEGEFDTGIYNAAGGQWSWRDTVRVMGVDADKVSCDSREVGFTGGLNTAWWDGRKLSDEVLPDDLESSIADGVRESLAGLGWP
jgi:nucleoside-diphosphate-sugar epimerase